MIGIISAVAFSFIVHEPSGIIVRSRARSWSASRRRYRSIWCSERCAVECRMGEVVRVRATPSHRTVRLMLVASHDRLQRRAHGRDTRPWVVVSSSAMPIVSAVDLADVDPAIGAAGEHSTAWPGHARGQRVEKRAVHDLDTRAPRGPFREPTVNGGRAGDRPVRPSGPW